MLDSIFLCGPLPLSQFHLEELQLPLLKSAFITVYCIMQLTYFVRYVTDMQQ